MANVAATVEKPGGEKAADNILHFNEAAVSRNVGSRKPDYEKLYFAAMGKLSSISDTAIKAQQELEDMYLKQTEPND